MEVTDLKIKDILQLKELFNFTKELDQNIYDKFIGKYVIIRSYDSGVHTGYLKEYDAQTRHVLLTNSRRLWHWKGFTLSQVANEGMVEGAKVSQALNEIIIANVIEIIPCTNKAIENLKNYSTHNPS